MIFYSFYSIKFCFPLRKNVSKKGNIVLKVSTFIKYHRLLSDYNQFVFYQIQRININFKLKRMRDYAFVEAWKAHHRRAFMILGLSLLCAPLSYSAYAEDGVSNTMVQVVAQTKTVKGTVIDESGEPLIGVSIVVKGTSTGTITDFDGKFSINLPAGSNQLTISYIGYKEQTVTVTGNSPVNVKMVADTQALDEVVVIGYGAVKKRDLTGAVSSVKGDDIKMAPVSNAMEALQGKVAGLDISRTDGRAGAEPTVLLRGNRSLNAKCDPLYIVDGIPGSISVLNPNDIQSIEVLKDASSTAIYGSAGANGVVIITTKQADKGKVQVDFDAYFGVNTSPSYPKAYSGQEWLDYLEAGYFGANGQNSNSRDELLSAYSLSPEQLNPYIDGGKWVDWVDEALHTGTQENYNVSVRGGNEKLQGYFSLGYNREKGIYKNDQNQLITMRIGTTVQLASWAKAGVQSTMSWKDRDSRGSRLNKTFDTLPLGDVYNEDGTIKANPIDGNSTVSLIADDVDGVYVNNNKTLRLTVNPFVELNPIKGLSIKSLLSGNFNIGRTGTFQNENTYMSLTGSDKNEKRAAYNTSMYYNYRWQNIITYNFKVKQDHDFTVTGISEWSKSRTETSGANSAGFNVDNYLFYNLGSGTTQSVASSYKETMMMSYAARLNYSYKGRYLVTLSNRWDGASQLANKWCAFPAAAAAWRISDEAFMEGTQNWLSNLKLRVGWGITGNANIDPYVTVTKATSPELKMDLGSGSLPLSLMTKSWGNKDLTWEKSYNTNFGLDISLFNGRIDLAVDYYYTNTKGVLYARPLPVSLGSFDAKNSFTMMSNIASINNKGLEISLSTRNIETKDFRWNSNFTFATNKEKLKSIDLGSSTSVDELIALNLFLDHPAKGTLYGYKYAGIWQEDEAETAALFNRKPGQVKLDSPRVMHDDKGYYYMDKGERKDITASSKYSYSAKDKTVLGDNTPDFSIGFQNSFYWKNFDLSILANMRWGQTENSPILGYFKYGKKVNLPEIYEYWTPTNTGAHYPQPDINGSTSDVALESLSIVDASYIKIKNITLGYTLPMKLCHKVGIQKLRVYGTVTNPFVFAKSDLLKNVDPETGGSDSYPLYKQVVFGINLSF